MLFINGEFGAACSHYHLDISTQIWLPLLTLVGKEILPTSVHSSRSIVKSISPSERIGVSSTAIVQFTDHVVQTWQATAIRK